MEATSAVQVDRSSILTVRQKPFAVQSSREGPFDTQAIEIISSWDLLRTYGESYRMTGIGSSDQNRESHGVRRAGFQFRKIRRCDR